MHTNSKFVKRAAATLVMTVSVMSAVFGLTACSTHGGGGFRGGGFGGGGGGRGVSEKAYNAPLHPSHIIK